MIIIIYYQYIPINVNNMKYAPIFLLLILSFTPLQVSAQSGNNSLYLNETDKNIATNNTINQTKSSHNMTMSIDYLVPRAVIAFILSFVIVLLILVITFFIVRKIRSWEKTKPRFWDIIRDDNWYPSLAIFQFLLWTGIVLFTYLGIALTRLFTGSDSLVNLPNSLIIVMGISAAVPVTGAAVSNFKYGGTTPTNVEPTKEIPSERIKRKLTWMENNDYGKWQDNIT